MSRSLIFALLLLTGCARDYTEEQTLTHVVYIKVFTPECVISCNLDTVRLLVTSKKVIMRTQKINLELAVRSKQFRLWSAEDRNGVKYAVGAFEFNKEFGLVFIPEDNAGLLHIGIAPFNLCE